jgi:hypothetical protein
MRPIIWALGAALGGLALAAPTAAQHQPAHERPEVSPDPPRPGQQRVVAPAPLPPPPRPVWWNAESYYTPQVVPGYWGPLPNYWFGEHYSDPVGGHYVSHYGRRFVPPAYPYFPPGWVYP